MDNQLSAVEVHLDTKLEEHLFFSIALNKSESAFIGLTYRSNSGTYSNNQLFMDIMSEVSDLAPNDTTDTSCHGGYKHAV